MLLVQVYGAGIAGAAIAAVLAETSGFAVGIVVAWRISQTGFAVPAATLFDRAKLMRMLAVNRDIMVRTAALIVVFLFFTAKGAREGDVTLAANVGAEQLPAGQRVLPRRPRQCRPATVRPRLRRPRRDAASPTSTRLVLLWGIGFALVVSAAVRTVRTGADPT